MAPVGFEPTMSAGERPQIYALDRASTGTGGLLIKLYIFLSCMFLFTIFFRFQAPDASMWLAKSRLNDENE